MYDALIIVNGEIPTPASWQDLSYRTLICTDGAANFLSQFTITPDIIIGDMDSIAVGTHIATAKSLQLHFPETKIDINEDQNTTDFEKVLFFAKQNDLKRILCVGALGKAADHALYNLSLIARYQTKLDITLLNVYDHHRQWIFPLQSNTRISTAGLAMVSLFPLPECVISTKGLQWELNQESLSLFGKGAIRNQSVSPTVAITTKGVCLCFVTCEAPPIISFS